MTAEQGAPTESQPTRGGKLTDRSLLRRFRQGSQEAATQLYLRYVERLRALTEAQCSPDLTWRVDVEDIVQSVFGSFFRRASQGYYDVPAGEELWKLFLVIALNKIRAKGVFHRAAKRDMHRTIGGEAAQQILKSLVAPENPDYAFLQLAIDEVLERLPPQHREMVQLRVEGYEVAEVARLMGRAKRSVERILQEGRRKLDELLQEEERHAAGSDQPA